MTSKNETSFTIESVSQTLQNLMEGDPLLAAFTKMQQAKTDGTKLIQPDDVDPVFQYAAALISSKNDIGSEDIRSPSISTNNSYPISGVPDIQENANVALLDIDRKLNLVQKLADQITLEKPEYIAAPLMRLHGYTPYSEVDEEEENKSVLSHGLFLQTLERCERLSRQASLLDSVADRVESTLVKGLDRISQSTLKLERVLQTSQVLKMIMRLQFETKKVIGSGIDFDALCSDNMYDVLTQVDLRDLTRVASSLAVMEELLRDPSLSGPGVHIDVVENIRPIKEKVSKAVRKAAARLLEDPNESSDAQRLPSVTKLGATLEVYYHLNELPDAIWNVISLALDKAERASGQFLNPSAINRLIETARSEATTIAEEESSKVLDKKKRAEIYERILKTKACELRTEVAHKWTSSVSDILQQIWQMHKVLRRKTDVVKRQNFLDIVQSAPIPDIFSSATELTGKGQKTSIFTVFWNQMCINLGSRIKRLINYEKGVLVSEVASLYPSVRAAVLEMLISLQETMLIGSISSPITRDESDSFAVGVLGGTFTIANDLIDDEVMNQGVGSKFDEGSINSFSADSWTKIDRKMESSGQLHKSGYSSTISALSSILASKEWRVLTCSDDVGLFPMQKIFFMSIRERLNSSIKNLFFENTVVDENGIGIKMLPILPSEKDLKILEESFRYELSFADPREGGGEFSMATPISECIVETVEAICSLAKGAISNVPESRILNESKGTMTDELDHDIKVAHVMVSFSK